MKVARCAGSTNILQKERIIAPNVLHFSHWNCSSRCLEMKLFSVYILGVEINENTLVTTFPIKYSLHFGLI